MGAMAERQMTAASPRHVETIWLIELSTVAIGGAENRADDSPFGYELSPYLDIFIRNPADALHRTLIAQELFDRLCDNFGIFAQFVEFGGLTQKAQHAVADQIYGRRVPGDEEEAAEVEDFVILQRAFIVFDGDEQGYEVGSSALPPFANEISEICGHRLHRRSALCERAGGGGRGLHAPHHIARPKQKLTVVRFRRAKEIHDRAQGKRHREIGDQFHLSCAQIGGEQAIGPLLNSRAKVFDYALREDLADEIAQAGVRRRIEIVQRRRGSGRSGPVPASDSLEKSSSA
ncbi:MAG TPA: hypothetical protein VK446_04055 [Methylocystis sp.]|nr:hypothetical protein [Methylocystis sp.]